MKYSDYRFPLFIDLRGRRAVIIGGGPIALRRAAALRDFGAELTLIAPRCGPLPEGTVYEARPYAPGDLQGAFLAVAATDCREVNAAVAREAREAGIFVSVADSPEESSFFFPALCTAGGLSAGVVSRGKEHRKTARAAREIRRILEDMT